MIEVNEKYFDIIDNEEKAYWLGYIYADGYSAQKSPWFLCIQTIDKNHIEKFSNIIRTHQLHDAFWQIQRHTLL